VMMRFLFFLLFFSNWSLKTLPRDEKSDACIRERSWLRRHFQSVCDATQKRPKKKTNVKVLLEANTSLQRDKISHIKPFLFVFSRVK
jgi:hypothetical protein